MSLANEFYARFAAEERMVELRSEAQMWRLARAAAGRRCPPADRLRLFTTRVTAASRQALASFAPGLLRAGPPRAGRLHAAALRLLNLGAWHRELRTPNPLVHAGFCADRKQDDAPS